MKKIIAILLVIALMSALFIVPAHAAEMAGDSIICRGCGSETYDCTTTTSATTWSDINGCTRYPFTHKHGSYTVTKTYICEWCEYRNVVRTTHTVCPYE
jgi:hypothetical protein